MAKVKKKKKIKKLPVRKKVKKKSDSSIKRARDGRFPKGVSGNLKGRPKGSGRKYSVGELEQAIRVIEEDKERTFLEEWVEAAWGDADKMATMANFMMPKLRAIEVQTLAEDVLPKEQADRIRKEIELRFNG